VTADTFNFAPAIFGGVTIMALVAYWVTPEEMWLRKEVVERVLDVTEDDRANVRERRVNATEVEERRNGDWKED
jgi:hypothetical protein